MNISHTVYRTLKIFNRIPYLVIAELSKPYNIFKNYVIKISKKQKWKYKNYFHVDSLFVLTYQREINSLLTTFGALAQEYLILREIHF